MNINEALRSIDWKKRAYFEWKHDIRYDQRKEKKTEEELLKYVQKKTLNSFIFWERTEEYANLVHLLLASKVHNDLLESYEKVSKKAREGDEKSIKLLLEMSKVIKEYAKMASQQFEKNENNNEDDDDLEL